MSKRHPINQSEACVFTLTPGVFRYSLLRGNMRAVNLRFRHDRQQLSIFGMSNPNRAASPFWLFLVHEAKSKYVIGSSFPVHLTDGSVKIVDKSRSVFLATTINFAFLTFDPDIVIARF